MRASSTSSSPRSCSRRGDRRADAGAGAGEQVGGHQSGEDDLAEDVALGHRGEARRGASVIGRVRSISGRVPVASSSVTSAASSSRVPIVEPITRELQEEDPGQLGVVELRARRRAADDDRAARTQRPDRVRPGRAADGLHDRVDLVRQPRAGLEHLVRAELERPGALGLVAAGREHPQAAGAGQR